MYESLIQAESRYNDLLPSSRLLKSPGRNLIAAANSWSEIVWDIAQSLGPMPLPGDQMNEGLRLIKHPVFICGTHRSGTTLVRDLLDGHHELVVLPSEGTFYTNLEQKLLTLSSQDQLTFLAKEWLRRLANPINQAPYWLLGRSKDESSPYIVFARNLATWWNILHHSKDNNFPHHAIVLAYASCTDSLSAKMWVDKTPTNERFLDRIKKGYDEAKIIHVIRDPANILSSRKKLDPYFKLGGVLIDLNVSFKIAVNQQRLHDKDYLLLRYEEVCDGPSTIARQLADFLNIQPSSSLLKPTVANIPTIANSSFQDETVTGTIHKWQRSENAEVLTVSERQMLAMFVGKLAGKLNYPLQLPGIFVRIYLGIKYFGYFIRKHW